MTAPAAATRQRGFALLIVLWSLGLLALLVTALAASARGGVGLAGNVRGEAMAQAAADGAVQQAVFQLRAGAWQPGEAIHRVVIGRAAVDVVIEDQSERINPNLSSPAMLASLLGAVGVDPALATNLSRLMVDWRTASTTSLAGGLKLDRYRAASLPYGPPNRPFASIDEIGLVSGMTLDLLERLRPYVSVYQTGDARQGANTLFSSNVLQGASAIGHSAAVIGDTSADQVVLVRATAVLGDGTRFIRRTVVRLAAQAKPGDRSWQILTWK